ncbi:phosphotransferase [Mycobacterium sp. AMU20-3851]|uniref:phosphotransferase family protein n=1 Tax=Mycobacterium sp. AMU20-3851 TaxID=3122055 RepID=UPI003754143F
MEPVQRRHPDAGAPAVITKLHPPGTDPQALRERLRVAARCPELLSPLVIEPEAVGTQWLTRWPRVEVVEPDPVRLPWAQAGELLARLHREPVDDFDVPHGAPARLARALHRLGGDGAAEVIRRAADALEIPDGPPALVHGDFHLGQLGWDGRAWVLFDVDDLGVGDPRWDLSRPAGFWAAGLLPDTDLDAFLDAYRSAGGPALGHGDPWPALDPFARAAVIAAAANHPDDELLVAACARMA